MLPQIGTEAPFCRPLYDRASQPHQVAKPVQWPCTARIACRTPFVKIQLQSSSTSLEVSAQKPLQTRAFFLRVNCCKHLSITQLLTHQQEFIISKVCYGEVTFLHSSSSHCWHFLSRSPLGSVPSCFLPCDASNAGTMISIQKVNTFVPGTMSTSILMFSRL